MCIIQRSDIEVSLTDFKPNEIADLSGLTLDNLEKNAVLTAIENSGGNLSRAALNLGITRQALYRKMAKFGLSR